MDVITATDEYNSPVPPARLFNALILDSDNLIPKIMPQIVKKIELVHGDGGPGSIKQMNFADGLTFKPAKHVVDELDTNMRMYKYALIKGDALGEKLEKISCEARFEASPEGGTVGNAKGLEYVCCSTLKE